MWKTDVKAHALTALLLKLPCNKPDFHQQNLCEGFQVLCSDLRIKDMPCGASNHIRKETLDGLFPFT